MFIPRVLIFDKIDGHLITNTGTINNGLKIKTNAEIINTFTELQSYDVANLHFYRCIQGEFDTEIYQGGIPACNVSIDEITWEYSPQQEEYQTEIEKLQSTNLTLATKIAELTIEKESTNATILTVMTEVAILKGGAS